jgi:hypothetical protein
MMEEITQGSPVITVKRSTHHFRFFVDQNGTVTYSLDGEGIKTGVKEVSDGKVCFKETVELFTNNDVEYLSGLTLSELDFATLKGKQNEMMAAFREKNDTVKEWSLDHKDKKELLAMVDKWQKRTATRTRGSSPQASKEKYGIHTFTVGNEKIRMIERYIDGKTLVNPDYKIFPDYPKAGGIGAKEGELMVWKYYYEKDEPSEIDATKKKGFWEIAREMRYTERICFEIISRYGYGKTLEQ